MTHMTHTTLPREQFDWTPVAAWWESGNEDFGNLKDAIRKMLAQQAAPAAREPIHGGAFLDQERAGEV